MLRDFTVSVLRERPSDLYDFAVDYFTRTRENRKPKSVPMYIIVDDDEDAGEPDPGNFKPKTQKHRFARRQSVSAERYDPEADEDEERRVHPKTDGQRERLAESVKNILLFKSLESEQMQEVIDAMFERKVEPGEKVIEQNMDGDNFYVIEDGVYDVMVTEEDGTERKVHVFDGKGSFGELALMYNKPRSATVIARTHATLWAMDRSSFRQIVLKSAFKKGKLYEELLERVPMLKHLNSYERMHLTDALHSQTYSDGQCIIKEGDEAHGMYFIEQGAVRVTITQDNKEQEVAQQTKGQYFGEMALIENAPRSATVYAIGKVKVAFIERQSFERLLGPCLDIMKRNIESYKTST